MSQLEARLKETAERDQHRPRRRCCPRAQGSEARLMEAMRYAALDGGKRLRPFFTLEAGRMFDADEGALLRAACAIECVHTYSLIHDDLPCMDDDDLRRGRPTLHRAFDEATALLAGDALLTFAFELLADPAHPLRSADALPADHRPRARRRRARHGGRAGRRHGRRRHRLGPDRRHAHEPAEDRRADQFRRRRRRHDRLRLRSGEDRALALRPRCRPRLPDGRRSPRRRRRRPRHRQGRRQGQGAAARSTSSPCWAPTPRASASACWPPRPSATSRCSAPAPRILLDAVDFIVERRY